MASADWLIVLTMIVSCGQLNVAANNVCYVQESGCKFRVTVLPMSSCPAIQHANDQPQASQVYIHSMHCIYTLTVMTRRRSESAYIRHVNFFTAFMYGWGGRWCPVKTESLSQDAFSK